MAATWLTIKEAATLLGVSEKTLRRWDSQGKLRARRHPVNNFRVYARHELEALVPSALADADDTEAPPVGPPAPAPPEARLPRAATSFVGRARELAALAHAFETGASAVALVGAAGIGKSRLAAHFAQTRADVVGPARIYCDLTEAHSLAEVCAVIGRAIGARFSPGAAADELRAHTGSVLASRGRVLIVLDTCEQVALPLAAALVAWREAAPETRWLLTSRARLPAADDAVAHLEVPPLALPPPDAPPAELESSEAVTLFRARAAAATGLPPPPDAPAARADAALIADIVRQLDGIPLAIELAAARSLVLGPADLHARLPRRFEVLAARPGRGAPDSPRAATLDGAIAWSWNLLAPHEQSALAQCAVFRGGFSLAAAESVLDLREHPGAPPALAVLESLRDQSLLRAEQPPDAPGTWRFGMFLSVRAFAADRLALAHGDDAARRHAAYYVAQGEALCAATSGPDGAAARRQLALERDNLLAVHARALAARPPRRADALRAALALDPLLFVQGPFDTYAALLEAALADEGGDPAATLAPALRALGLEARGRLYRLRGRLDESAQDLERARALARDAGDARAEGLAHRSLCVLALHRGDVAAARAHGEAARERFDACGDARLGAFARACLGELALREGRLDEALDPLREARAVLAAAGDQWLEGLVLITIGSVYLEQDKLDDARLSYARALAALTPLNDRREGVVRGCLGYIAHAQGRLLEARECYVGALAQLREAGVRAYEGLFCAALGAAEAELECADAARAAFDQADVLLRGAGDPSLRSALAVHALHLSLAEARAAVQREMPERARELLAHARAAARAPSDGAHGGEAPRETEDVRFARRILARACDETEALLAGHAAPRALGAPPRGDAGLTVDARGRWFVLARGARVDLSRRGVLRRVFAALLARRRAAPDTALDTSALLAAGWPGERVLPEAGAHRVRVAVATLRKLGLREVLLHREDGYLLDPAVPIDEITDV